MSRPHRFTSVVVQLGLLLTLVSFTACGSDAGTPTKADAASDATQDTAATDAAQDISGDATQTGGPVKGVPFCPAQGQAIVRQLQAGEGLTGPAAMGRAGDWVIANRQSAFVIQAPGAYNTYYYYGGLPIDAAPLGADCAQSSPETFGEIAFAVGNLNTSDFGQSVLRGFRGDKAEVIADGKDGKPAVLRVWGSDQYFWLVEMELIRRVHEAGGTKPRSQPLGVQLAIDYVLPADGSALEMRLHVFNATDKPVELIAGLASFPDDATELVAWSSGKLDVGGFGLQTFVPFVSGRGATSWALASAAQNLSRITISGVDALIDLGQMGSPLAVAPKGQKGDEAVQTWWLAVAKGSNDQAVANLQPSLPPAQRVEVTTITGTVKALQTGEPVSNAEVVLERQSGTQWKEVVSAPVVQGQYSLQAPAAAEAQRITLRKAGWPAPEPRALPVKTADFVLAPPAQVLYEVRDDKGALIPAKIFFYQGNTLMRREYAATGKGEVLLPPGEYDVTVARGYEYALYEAKLQLAGQTSTQLPVTLAHLVDTAGFLSLDGHVHAAPSADSTVPMAMRFVTAAAEGLEVVMHTDHEIITDPSEHLKASGVAPWVASVPGEELTASNPEHMNLWGVAPDPNHPRGRPVPWFDKDVAQLYSESRTRGAQIITLNHPRQAGSCNYLCAIDWNRLTGKPNLDNPEAMGLPKGATLWSWEFDAVELMNGLGNPFATGVDPKRNGIWDDWMSFLNFGHRITGVGVTDVHDYSGVGTPRTYFAAPTDDPAQFTMAMATAAIQGGKALVSAGAFARVTIGGKSLGETVKATDGMVEISVEVQAIPQIDVQRVVIWANCDEVASIPATVPDGVVKLKTTVKIAVPKDAHVVVGAFGKYQLPRGFDAASDVQRVPRVLTNPVYVDADGDGVWTPPGGKACTYTVGP